jgi:intein/homing endonuclease
MARSKVAVLRVSPDTILQDIDRLHGLAEVEKAFDASAQTILKDNISWHYPFPGANTTPWQLEGTIRALRARGFQDQVCVQNKTVVTDAFKGEDLNGYVPIFEAYGVPVRYNFKPEDMSWSLYQPKAKLNVLDQIYPEGILIPDDFHGRNIVHLPTVKCVAGDTEVVLADGSVRTIADLMGEQAAKTRDAAIREAGTVVVPCRVRLFAMTRDGRTGACAGTAISRSERAGRRVVRLTTRTGRTLTATADHRIHTPSGWVELGALRTGDRIAIARRLRVSGKAQALPRTFAATQIEHVVARAGRKYTQEFNQHVIDAYVSGQTATAIAAGAGVRWQSVQAVLKRHDVPLRGNVSQLRIPVRTSPELWRWLGYLIAEGNVGRGTSDKIWWINQTKAIRDEFVALTRSLFGLRARVREDGRSVYVYSKSLGRFLEEIGLPVPLDAGNKRVPPALFRGTDEEIAAFLSGYLDGDGHVAARQAEVSATTKSVRLARDLMHLYARLGVVASRRLIWGKAQGWTEARPYQSVVVSGAAVAQLADVLTFRHPEKAKRLVDQARRLAASKQPSNWDVVPFPPELFRGVREGLGFTQESTGKPGSVNNIENGHAHPTPRIARYFVDVFDERDRGGRFAAQIDALRKLATEDLAWDAVASIEDVDDDIALYDISVPDADCFVANGIIAHNCHIYTTTTGAMKNAFGGLLNTKRHYTHSWIHATLVDLLAIQQEIHAGVFAVMDGTTAGDGPGPRTMRPHIKNVMLASADQVAIDAVSAAMMGFDPMAIDYIRIADEQGLGHGRREDIEVVGDAALADERWGFSVGDNGASMVGDLLWFGPLKRIQKLFFHTPLVKVFVLGSEVYHDYYRWPLRDRRIFDAWRRDTAWGELFDYYRAHGTLGPVAAPGVVEAIPVSSARPEHRRAT